METVHKTPIEQVGLNANRRKNGDLENDGGKFQSSASSSVSSRLATVYASSAPGNGDAIGSNVTFEGETAAAADDGELGLLMGTDSIVAMGTIAGTVVTAAVMVGVIVHLCRKEKASSSPSSAKPKTASTVLQTEVRLATATGGGTLQGGRQEMVYRTPDLQSCAAVMSVTNDARNDSTLQDRRRRCRGMLSGCRDSCPIEHHHHDWVDTGRPCRAAQTGSYNGVDLRAEFASLMGGQSVDGRVVESPVRMYKWEDL